LDIFRTERKKGGLGGSDIVIATFFYPNERKHNIGYDEY